MPFLLKVLVVTECGRLGNPDRLARIHLKKRPFRTTALRVHGYTDVEIDGPGCLVSRSSPAFVRSRSVDLRKRHVDEPEIHGELATMVDEVIQVLADHFPTWCHQ